MDYSKDVYRVDFRLTMQTLYGVTDTCTMHSYGNTIDDAAKDIHNMINEYGDKVRVSHMVVISYEIVSRHNKTHKKTPPKFIIQTCNHVALTPVSR